MVKTRLGRVKTYNSEKGYGFIVQANGPDVFVHNTEIRMEGFRQLNKNDIVSYQVVETKRGMLAKNVRVVKADGSSEGQFNFLEFKLYSVAERAESLMAEAADLINDFGELVEGQHGSKEAQKYYLAADRLVDVKEKAVGLEELDETIDGLVAKILEILG